MFYQKKELLEKAATIKILEYWLLGSELKKQRPIKSKEQKRLLKNRQNVIDNNRKDNDNDKEDMRIKVLLLKRLLQY